MSESKVKLNRRNFLLALGASGAAGAAALLGNNAASTRFEAKGDDGRRSAGYRASEHVRNYYRTAKV